MVNPFRFFKILCFTIKFDDKFKFDMLQTVLREKCFTDRLERIVMNDISKLVETKIPIQKLTLVGFSFIKKICLYL